MNVITESPSFIKNDLHIDLERGKRVFNKYCQVFAVWIPDEKRGDEAYDYFNNVYAFFEKQLLKNYNAVAFCRSSGEMDNAFGENKIAAFLSVEGGAGSRRRHRCDRCIV